MNMLFSLAQKIFTEEVLRPYLFLMARWVPLCFLSPLFDHSCFSGVIKFYLMFALGMAFSPLAWVTAVPVNITFLDISRELIIGGILGGLSKILFDSFKCLGEFIGSEIGLSNVLLPPSAAGPQNTVLAHFIENLALLFLWTQGIVTIFFTVWYQSYEIFPWISSFESQKFVPLLSHFFICLRDIFEMTIKMSLPFLLTGWVSTLSLGLLNRFLPNLQVFSLSSSFQILLGLFMFKIIFQQFCHLLEMCSIKIISFLG